MFIGGGTEDPEGWNDSATYLARPGLLIGYLSANYCALWEM